MEAVRIEVSPTDDDAALNNKVSFYPRNIEKLTVITKNGVLHAARYTDFTK